MVTWAMQALRPIFVALERMFRNSSEVGMAGLFGVMAVLTCSRILAQSLSASMSVEPGSFVLQTTEYPLAPLSEPDDTNYHQPPWIPRGPPVGNQA